MAVFTEVGLVEAEGLARRVGLGAVKALKPITAGIENTNYFLSTERGEYVLTLFERLGFEQLPFYLHLMQHLKQRGIPVPGPQADAQGEILHRLAGKPAAYLYNQLLNFREGRRHYGLMTQMVEPLSDAYLLEIAQYFAALKVPYPAPPPGRPPAALLAQGRQLVLHGDPARQVPACVQCHGERMTGVLPQVPGLLGLPHDYLNAQLGAWKAGKRRAHAPDCMAQVVERLSLDDINAAASWLAAQPVPAQSEPALKAAAGTSAVPACGSASLPTPTGPTTVTNGAVVSTTGAKK